MPRKKPSVLNPEIIAKQDNFSTISFRSLPPRKWKKSHKRERGCCCWGEVIWLGFKDYGPIVLFFFHTLATHRNLVHDGSIALFLKTFLHTCKNVCVLGLYIINDIFIFCLSLHERFIWSCWSISSSSYTIRKKYGLGFTLVWVILCQDDKCSFNSLSKQFQISSCIGAMILGYLWDPLHIR